jgi:putative membrane protein
MATTLAYINEALILSSALSMAIGWWQIRRNNVHVHKRFMVLSVWLAGLFFLMYAAKTVLMGDTMFGGSAEYRTTYQTFLQMHSVLATVAGVLGVITLRYGFKKSFSSHTRVGRITAPIWFVTAASGLGVFLMLYVFFPSGPTVNVFRAWVGF